MKGGNYLREQSPGDKPDDTLSRFWKQQPMLARCSYAVGAFGALLGIHDFHHPRDSFGYSTPILGLSILLYLFTLRRPSGAARRR